MGFWDRLLGRKSETRSITSLPWNYGGDSISTISQGRAMTLVPVYASVRLLSETVSALPLKAYREVDDTAVQIPDPKLLTKPGPRDDMQSWLSKIMVSRLLRGNAYGLILDRDGFGFPVSVEIVSPDDVYVDEQSSILPQYYHRGKLVNPDDIVHIPWIVQPGRVVALSPVQDFASTIGVGLEAVQHGKRYFEQGGVPPFVLKNESNTLTPEQSTGIYQTLKSRKQGAMLIGADWEFTPINVTLQESQFLETIQANAAQIASIYGVPPHMVGGSELGGESLTYANVEQRSIEFLTYCLSPHLVKLERAISAMLPEKQFVKFNTGALLKTDLKTRYESHQIGIGSGFLSIDEARALEERPPLPNGMGGFKSPETNDNEEASRG